MVNFRSFDNLNTSHAIATFDAIDDTKVEQIEGILNELNPRSRKECVDKFLSIERGFCFGVHPENYGIHKAGIEIQKIEKCGG